MEILNVVMLVLSGLEIFLLAVMIAVIQDMIREFFESVEVIEIDEE